MNPHELTYLKMNAPIEIDIRVGVMVPDLKLSSMRPAFVQFTLPKGVIPTQADLQAKVANCMDSNQMAEPLPVGARFMTKPEYIGHSSKRVMGRFMSMDGPQEFEPMEEAHVAADMFLDDEMAKSVMIDALKGRGVSPYAYDKYFNAGLVTAGGNQRNPEFFWSEQIKSMTRAELRELYRDIYHEEN